MNAQECLCGCTQVVLRGEFASGHAMAVVRDRLLVLQGYAPASKFPYLQTREIQAFLAEQQVSINRSMANWTARQKVRQSREQERELRRITRVQRRNAKTSPAAIAPDAPRKGRAE